MKQWITGATIFDGDELQHDMGVFIDDQRIMALDSDSVVPSDAQHIVFDGGFLVPGFIDIQVNGGGGLMFNTAHQPNDIQTILSAHRRYGTTNLLPTVITDDRSTMTQAVQAVNAAMALNVPGILGVHIEGPFFHPQCRGVHKEEYIRKPEIADLEWIDACEQGVTLITLAPDVVPVSFIQALTQRGIRVSCGHSNADFQTVTASIEAGVSCFTHLFNAMRQMTAREPGVVGAALTSTDTWFGIIVDKTHVHEASLQAALACKPLNKILLVSDAMALTGAKSQTTALLYDEEITVKDKHLVNADGRLAGSIIGMIDAVKNTTEWLGQPLTEALRMASLYPAQFLGINDLGRIKNNYLANLTYFDSSFQVQATWLEGHYEQYSSP